MIPILISRLKIRTFRILDTTSPLFFFLSPKFLRVQNAERLIRLLQCLLILLSHRFLLSVHMQDNLPLERFLTGTGGLG